MENRLMVRDGHLLAVFNSGHRVMKAENILKALGLPILLIPAPRQLQTDCGLALRFTEEEQDHIMQVLERERLLPAFVSRYQGGEFITIWTQAEHDANNTQGDDV